MNGPDETSTAAAGTAGGWLQRPDVQRVLWPCAVAVVLLVLWQALVVAFEVPVFLVPSPARVAQVMWDDAALLFGALLPR